MHETARRLQVVETHPYEKLSHAVVAWVDENLDRCDVIHTHEWGGVFTDLATLVNFRQLKPGEGCELYIYVGKHLGVSPGRGSRTRRVKPTCAAPTHHSQQHSWLSWQRCLCRGHAVWPGDCRRSR